MYISVNIFLLLYIKKINEKCNGAEKKIPCIYLNAFRLQKRCVVKKKKKKLSSRTLKSFGVGKKFLTVST